MNITPERALELANKMKPGNDGYTIPSASEAVELAAILRHYAEILPKWQAARVPEEMPVPYHGMRLLTADEAYVVGYANGFNFCRKSIIGLRTKPGVQQICQP